MIEVTHLHKSYGNIKAVNDLTFTIQAGAIVGLLGPNGAGKTTLIKLLTGYIQPDEGQILIDRINVLEEPRRAQAIIGYLPENAPLYPELTVQSYLKMMADLREIPVNDQLKYISAAVHAVALEDYLTKPIMHLSKGYRQRVGLAQAILHKPRLLILDEPTVGLDPTQIIQIRALIRSLAEHSTILFSTHILPEVEALCDRVMIMLNGELRADARLDELAASQETLLMLAHEIPGVEKSLKELPGVRNVTRFTPRQPHAAGYRITPVQPGTPGGPELNQAVYALATSKDWPVLELKYEVRTLEAVFNELALGKTNLRADVEVPVN